MLYPEDFEEEDFEVLENCQDEQQKKSLIRQYGIAQAQDDEDEMMDLAIELYTRFGHLV